MMQVLWFIGGVLALGVVVVACIAWVEVSRFADYLEEIDEQELYY